MAAVGCDMADIGRLFRRVDEDDDTGIGVGESGDMPI
jgi:hypothetical protein